jgi:hypothetical protein
MSLSTPSGLRAASPRNSEDYSDSTRTPLGLQWTGLGLGLEICRPLAGGLVRLESEWSPSVRSESDWSPLGKVGECKDLKIADTFYEVWSPNCDKVDFYPRAPLTTDLASYHHLPLSYIDGCLGPQDWTLHPQYFNSKAPWLGFCQHPPTVTSQSWCSMNPELVPLPAVWQPCSIDPKSGCLDPEYLSILQF